MVGQRVPPGVPRRADALRRPPVADDRVRQPRRRAGPAPLPQARGPEPHRQPQGEQRDRPGAARQADGQDPPDRRDRRRPARRRHRHRCRTVRHEVHRLHGRGRHEAPSAQRVPHGPARCRQSSPLVGKPHAEGRRERGHAGLGQRGRTHALLHRHRHGPTPVPVDGAQLPRDHRVRVATPDDRICSASNPTSPLPASVADRTRPVCSPDSPTTTRSASSGSNPPAARRSAAASPPSSTA